MKTITQLYIRTKECQHSAVFSPALANPAATKPIATSVYINKAAIPPGTQQLKLTMTLAEGPADQAYNGLAVS